MPLNIKIKKRGCNPAKGGGAEQNKKVNTNMIKCQINTDGWFNGELVARGSVIELEESVVEQLAEGVVTVITPANDTTQPAMSHKDLVAKRKELLKKVADSPELIKQYSKGRKSAEIEADIKGLESWLAQTQNKEVENV